MGGGVNTDEVFYNFTGTKVTKLRVRIESPGNYVLACIYGDISTDKPTIIDWGNGTKTTLTKQVTEYNQVGNSTDYSEPGEYEISIDGWYNHFKCYYYKIEKPDLTQINEVLTEIIQVSSLITSFYETFKGCSNLTSIPSGLFDKNIKVTSLGYTFSGCKSLTSIPDDLFGNNTSVTSFSGTFGGCSSLANIPSVLFDYNTDVMSFDSTFSGCSSLTKIPSDLFDKNTKVTRFDSTFSWCKSLTSIPDELFYNNTNVTSFGSTFCGCSGLTSIPDKLFYNNTEVTVFYRTFEQCSNLTSIPTGLFDKNASITSFGATFFKCSNLTGETPYTLSSDGVTKIKLWDRDEANGFAKVTSAYYVFGDCTKLADYEDIPSDWK